MLLPSTDCDACMLCCLCIIILGNTLVFLATGALERQSWETL